jgi:hypothetical protein
LTGLEKLESAIDCVDIGRDQHDTGGGCML